MIRSIAFAALSPALLAQTFVVDAANGPGTHFLEIAAATAAVPDGAVIVVRAGAYVAFTVSGKGLTIVGEPGATVASFTVSGTAANQPVTIRDLAFGPGSASTQCTSCQGPVLLQRLARSPNSFAHLVAQQCAQLVVDHCGPFVPFGPIATSFAQSNAVCIASNAIALNGAAMRVLGGRIQLVDCDMTSVSTGPFSSSAGVLDVQSGAEVRMVGGSVTATAPLGGGPPAIAGAGTVRLDPNVVVTGPVLNVTLVTAPLAAVVGTGGSIASTAAATMRGPAGSLGVLLLGVAAAPVAVPGIENDLWLEPGAVPMAAAVFGAPLAAAVAVPNDPLLVGFRFGWQGVTLAPTGVLALSNPAVFAP